MSVLVSSGLAALLLGASAIAQAQGARAMTWDQVVKGQRRQLKGWRGKVTRDAWHALAIEARGDHLQVFWEGTPIIDVHDGTFPDAGKLGVWTKADSVTHFDALTATPLG